MNKTSVLKTGGEPNPVDKTGLCLLSLDGGGVRGLSSLYVLKALMQRLNHERQKEGLPTVKPCEVFDLIGGTSTGGLIAIMLGRLEMTVEACITAYEELTGSVFEAKSSRLPIGWSGKTKAQFDSDKLRKAVEKVVSENGASIGDLFNDERERGCRVFVCATAFETTGTTRLRSYSVPGKTNTPATICEAALATSAATGFFDPVQIGARKFEDGGLGANNPAEEVEGEAADIWCSETRDLMPLVKCFLSIGTGNPGKKAIEDNMLKFLSKTLVALVTETEKTERRMTSRWARYVDEKRYFRLNVEQGLQDVGLAEYRESGKIEAATAEYIEHPQQVSRVRDCVINLKGKESRTNTTLEAVVKEYTARMIRLQPKSKVFSNIPFAQNKRFVGRDRDLEKLETMINDGREGNQIAITGLGGIGKTQIALELAHRIRNQSPDCSIFWIPAINQEGLEQTYVDIVQELKIPGCQEKGADSKALLRRHLSQKNAGRWLMIFDNADDVDMWLGKDKQRKYLVDRLPRSDTGCILFTTRDTKTAVKLASQNVISVADMDEEMAVQLLRGYLIQNNLVDDMQNAAKLLLRQLAFLPLAIVQAAAYMNENAIQPAEYLELLGEQEEDVVDLLSEDFEDDGRYRNMDTKNPVATTWLISFKQIRSRDALAADYLSFMACVEPIDIPQSMLPGGKSRTQETSALGLLKAYSFVVEKSTKATFDMHRLVHLATRSWLRDKERLQDNYHLTDWVIKVRRRLNEVFPDDDHENRSVWRLYLPHARRVLGYEVHNEQDAVTRIHLLWKFAICSYEDGKYNEAGSGFAKVVGAFKGMLGEEHQDTISAMNNLATTLGDQGELKEAVAVKKEVLEKMKRILSEEHPSTITAMNNLANTLGDQGELKEAVAIQKEVLEKRKRILGEEHPDTITAMNNLATTLGDQGELKEAVAIQKEVLEKRKRILGEEHPSTITAMNNLATTLGNQSELKEAVAIQKEVLEKRKRILSEEHPSTITAINNLATTLGDQGELKEAVILLELAYSKIIAVRGENHPHSKIICANLTRHSIGQFTQLFQDAAQEDEEQVCQRTLSNFERIFGSHHMSTVQLMRIVAGLYEHQGKAAEAEQMYRRGLECCEETTSLDDTIYRELLSGLGQLYHRCGKWIEAEEVFRKELQHHEQYPDHQGTLPLIALIGLYQIHFQSYMSLREKETTQRGRRMATSSNDVETKDVIASLAHLCKKFATALPPLLGLLGQILIWTGKDDDAVIAFQHQGRLVESKTEQDWPICDGCGKQLNAGKDWFVCKACVDVDLCSDCFAEYEIDGRLPQGKAEQCQAHPFLAVFTRGEHGDLDSQFLPWLASISTRQGQFP